MSDSCSSSAAGARAGRPGSEPVAVSYLEMRRPEALRPRECADPRFRILECTVPQWRFNRFLYAAVGADWNWHEKSGWTDEQWRQYVEAPNLRTFGAYYDGSPAGYYELLGTDDPKEVEIAYLGLLPAFIGRGLGAVLLTSALREAWRMGPARVWLHTCTEDHPVAVANYQARGLSLYKVEAG